MPAIVLSTMTARYVHPAFGLRWLLANLGELQAAAALVEFDLDARPADMAEQLVARDPLVIGISVHIWNATPLRELLGILRAVAPNVAVVLGGPEVSHAPATHFLTPLADYVVAGEGERAFADLCREVLAGRRPAERLIAAPPPDLAALALPYDLYTDDDLRHRLTYVEASRGCPYACEYCASSVTPGVRRFPRDRVLAACRRLLERGARRLKFVDRSFNAGLDDALPILEFFLAECRPGLQVHFEMVPDRFPEPLRAVLRRAPPGLFRLELGIQTFNEAVAARLGRRQDNARVEEDLRFLRDETGAVVHADLIVGLPGEDLASFAAGFDRLVGLAPAEIQVGFLKRLRGTAIGRHDGEWDMRYNPAPPYEILASRDLDFATIQRLRRFARFWNLLMNSGLCPGAVRRLWADGASPFTRFLDLSDGLFAEFGRAHAISRIRLLRGVRRHLVEQAGVAAAEARALLPAAAEPGAGA